MSYHISSRAKETDKGLGEIQLWFMGMDVDVDVDILTSSKLRIYPCYGAYCLPRLHASSWK